MSEAIVLGPTARVDFVVDLAVERQRSSRPWRPYMAGAFVVLAFVLAAFGLAVRRETGLLWLTLALASLGGVQASDIDAGLRDDPYIALWIGSVGSVLFLWATLLFVRRLLGVDTKAARALTWVGVAVLAVQMMSLIIGPSFLFRTGSLVMVYMVVASGYALVVAVRKGRSGQPDTRILAGGVGAMAVGTVLEPASAVAALSGHISWQAFLHAEALSDLGSALLALSMCVVIARRYARTLTNLEASFAASRRFVPQRFLSLLGRKELTEVRRADATEQEMAVLFADIRGFTTRSEAAGAAATFALVNRYLEAIEPAIHAHDGFINKFLGDGILALYPDAHSAAASARALQEAVTELNGTLEQEDDEPLRVGVGIHFGPVMLGTVGGRQQLDTTVIADVVNTASRVESLTKRYGVDILATQALIDALDDEARVRELDRVRVVGRKEPVTLHQLY